MFLKSHTDKATEKSNDHELELFENTTTELDGGQRRLFIARVVLTLGKGGQRFAEKIRSWNGGTIRKGLCELKFGHNTTRP
jgi:hypothetical protein